MLLAALVGFGVFFDRTAAQALAEHESPAALQAQLAREGASPEVQHVAQWALHSEDNAGLPFLVVDKARARLWAFDATGRLRASAPVLLGASRGDAPDVPATPAGRFVVDAWQTALGEGIVWVNDTAAVNLYGMPSAASPGRGPQRLSSGELEDKRISDGSMHVAGDFYREFLAPLRTQASVAYVLPESMPVRDMFAFRSPATARAHVAQSPRSPITRRPS